MHEGQRDGLRAQSQEGEARSHNQKLTSSRSFTVVGLKVTPREQVEERKPSKHQERRRRTKRTRGQRSGQVRIEATNKKRQRADSKRGTTTDTQQRSRGGTYKFPQRLDEVGWKSNWNEAPIAGQVTPRQFINRVGSCIHPVEPRPN